MKAKRENGRGEDVLWSTADINQACGKAEIMKVISKERSTQSSDELKTLGADGGVKQHSGGNHPTSSYLWQTGIPYVTSRYKLINGFPSDNIVNITRSYAMSFDNNTGNAELVYEILNRNTLVNNCDPISFGQGYDKGHLAAARNHRNIIPQNHLLNIRVWKDLENKCRNMTTDNEIRNVHVYTGPLYIRPMPYFELEGRRKIVPTHLFKVIIVENVNGTVRAPGCYVMPNEAPQTTDLNVYRMNIGEFQRVSGLTFIEHGLNLGDTDSEITRVVFDLLL
uniref:Uncharacterized protein n=1 Tax=Sinocyclocheilus rhinocerous TaxID=307959 RepID=A0A673IRP4_9TELE